MKRLVPAVVAVALIGGSIFAAALECVVVMTEPLKTARNIAVTVTKAKLAIPSMDLFVVDAKDGNSKEIAHGKTDERGQVVFRDLPPGKYSINSSSAPPYVSIRDIIVENRAGTTSVPIAVRIPPQPPPPSLRVVLKQISGLVVDQTGAFIPKAELTVERPDRTIVASAATDDSGRVQLNVPSGDYIMRVVQRGFEAAMVPVQVTPEAKAWPAFRLTMFVGTEHCGDFESPSKYKIESEPAHENETSLKGRGFSRAEQAND